MEAYLPETGIWSQTPKAGCTLGYRELSML